MSKWKLSALLPYKPGVGERDYIWSCVKQRYDRFFPQIELCIGTDGDEPFCRSRAVNQAAKQATGDVLLIVDMDVVFNEEIIDGITAEIYDHPWLIPFDRGQRLTQGATIRLLKQGLPQYLKIAAEDVEKTQTKAGPLMNVMTRKCFELINGMDERFKGWGREDRAMVCALDTLCGRHFRMEGCVYHLWHHKQKAVQQEQDNNLQLYLQYKAANGKVAEMKKLVRHK